MPFFRTVTFSKITLRIQEVSVGHKETLIQQRFGNDSAQVKIVEILNPNEASIGLGTEYHDYSLIHRESNFDGRYEVLPGSEIGSLTGKGFLGASIIYTWVPKSI